MVEQASDGFYGALAEDDPADLYDNAPCAYLSTLPDGIIVKANRTFLTWTGFPEHALVGRVRFQELLAPGDRIFYETHVSPALMMQDHVREIAVEVVTESGARLPVLANSILKRDVSGSPSVIRTALFDATERRAYERELLASRRRAEASEARAAALATTLQSTFVPTELPRIPGLDIGHRYRPAGDGSEVGGDFYDLFEIGTDTWGLVLGDVCGKGAGAAVLASVARYTVRAEAIKARDAVAVLFRLHEALLRYQPGTFCTAVFAVIERVDGRFRIAFASGGHPAPIHRHHERTEAIVIGGSIVGMINNPHFTSATVTLEPGDLVVLYSDGVTEARHERDFFGEERLTDLVRAFVGGAQQHADAYVEATVAFQDGNTRDDIAVIVVRAPLR